MPSAAAVEAENELIEIGLNVLAAQAVIDTERPDLEVGCKSAPQWDLPCAA